MKKILMLVAAAAVVASVAVGCGSIRTPKKGGNSKANYYNTVFGVSVESAVYGDDLVVNPMSNN